MKKFTLAVAFLVSLLSTKNAQAQTFTLEKDTVKGAWMGTGYDIQMKVKATNTSVSSITYDWRISSLHKDYKWYLTSACEPSGLCYLGETPGLQDGTKTFNSGAMKAGESGTFIIDFNADTAASNTTAYAVMEISSGGGPVKKIVFVAEKKATGGITTSIRNDEEISIFPNPASNYIDVLYNAASDVKTIAIYNLIGKVVNVYKVTDKNGARCEFASDMPSGIYLVRVADSKGRVIATRKITHQ